MTPHGKAHHKSHCSYFPTIEATVRRRRSQVERISYGNVGVIANPKPVESSKCRSVLCRADLRVFRIGTRLPSRSARLQPARDIQANRARHCASSFAVRSIFLSGVGSASWLGNQGSSLRGRRVEKAEHLFRENSREKISASSGASLSRSGPSSPRSTWRSGRGFQNAARSTSSTAGASRTHARRPRSISKCSTEPQPDG